jgi:hypothetical protein
VYRWRYVPQERLLGLLVRTVPRSGLMGTRARRTELGHAKLSADGHYRVCEYESHGLGTESECGVAHRGPAPRFFLLLYVMNSTTLFNLL